MKNYIKTAKYDENFVSENWMGPNPLILLEELCGHLDLKPGMRVLDMGCGNFNRQLPLFRYKRELFC
jgi:cyclopropane fatty-acyl-phospholipid synthase-like methyltransferase